MRANEFLVEGGWASTLTQNTKITPQLVDLVVQSLPQFQTQLNDYLKSKDLPPVEVGTPVGSTTYYKRDLQQNPTREYGDIDVNFYIPKLPDITNNAVSALYTSTIKEFCDQNPNYSSNNGQNIIIKIGNEYVQVDLVLSYTENKGWSPALGPEYNVKGVLSASLSSALAEALNLSISGHGVQVKLKDGVPVSFRQSKDVVLKTISTNPKTWALDIAKFFGCDKIADLLKQHPGMGDEVRTQDLINSIKGIAQSLELCGKIDSADALIHQIKSIYASKILTAINSSKYEKAETPAAKKKAADTKALLTKDSQRILGQFE